ncbi:MAG: hypothetical protein FJ254_03790 [Phycisphaerae bacterium]|nr:hypothetical protein [Phycisphaerae bacterium]
MTGPILIGPHMRAGACAAIATGPLTLDGAPWGTWLPGTLLHPGSWPEGTPRVLAFTGSLSGTPDQGDLRNWMPAGIQACRGALASAHARAAERSQRLVIVPHALHIISDLHSTLRLLREHPDLGVAIAPAALLTESMLDHAADHLARILGTLGPVADAIILHDLVRSVDEQGEPAVTACDWGRGVLDTKLVESLMPRGVLDAPLVESLVPGGIPTLILGA